MDRKKYSGKCDDFKVKICAKADCGGQTKINAKDAPLTIDKKGSYILDGNISACKNVAPITIIADDVVLDLGGHTIDLKGKSNVGIYIASPTGGSIKNVVVRNGTIKNTPGVSGPDAAAVAIANDVTFPLVAVVSGTPLPVGPSASYPLTSIPITVAGILANGLEGAIFENIIMYNVLYGLVALQTVGYVRVDKSKFFDFGLAVPSSTATPTAYGCAVFLAGTPSVPAVDLRMTNCDLNSQASKFATVVFSADGCVWEGNSTSSDSGPNPSPTGQPLIQGPIEFINCSGGVVRECESRGSNTMLETQYCEAFEFIDCCAWQVFHNGIGILFCTDMVIKGCIVHSVEGYAPISPSVATGSGIKLNASNYVTLEDSIFTGFNVAPFSATNSNGAGIAVAGSQFCIIQNNKTSGNNWGIKETLTATLTQNGVAYVFPTTVPTPPPSNNYIANFSNANGVPPTGANYLLLAPYDGLVVTISTNLLTPVPSYVNLQP